MESLHNLANSVAGRRPKRQPLKVLVADADAVSRMIAVRLLERRGHDVCAVEASAEALRTASHKRFDLVLLDLDQAAGDGTACAAEIRKAGIRNGIHTAIWGMSLEVGGRHEILQAAPAFDLLLAKPLDSESLTKALRRLSPEASE